MKTLVPHLSVFALSFCLASQAAEIPAVTAVFVNPNAAENVEIRDLGGRPINRIGSTLVNEVSSAMAKGGPDKAVDFCHLKALPMTGEIITGMPRITGVKRTSLRLRNPANAPDAAEKLALARVEAEIENGNPPKVLVQRIDLPGAKREWRVYRPVGVAPQCLACHGPKDSMSPALQARLAERYPADQATDYSAGQWRGLIRVTVAEAPAAPPAKAAPAKTTTKS